ncbi:MAG: arginine--tRNA ligase [Dehalococcoidia bacterium]|nr:arginine--tRNA ligase [Dehalococcoidia bacterium]
MDLIRLKIAEALKQAVAAAERSGALPPVGTPEVVVERPANAGHGDYACNLALKLARAARMKPLDIAQRIADNMPKLDAVASVSVAPPGFINVTLADSWLQRAVPVILAEADAYGRINIGNGQRIQVEFVSVNPTGPVHIGHGRGAVLGSALASVLDAAGFSVQREYYINDAGNQMDNFYASLYARAAQSLGLAADMPANGYMGAYVGEVAAAILQEHPALAARIAADPADATREIGAIGLQKMIARIKNDLESLGVSFDLWFSERSLFDSGQYDRAMQQLAARGYTAQREGATWFTSTSLGEDKDNVLVRTSGTPTYFASDIAYHHNKFAERNFARVIDIWGADHQGHVARLKAAVTALGIDPARLTIILSQLVTLRRGDQVVKISKRTGDIITLREVIDEVGKDVCRFFLLSHSADSQMDFDLELAKTQSQDNPVYYVQYGHARIASILRLAAERGIPYQAGDVSLLTHESELALIRKMLQLPEVVEQAAVLLEPHHLTRYAQELAAAFHWFYKQCRVVTDDQPLTAARLRLVAAAQLTLARTLHLMGMSAPEQM